MNALDTVFSLWFNAAQTAQINLHVEENFNFNTISRRLNSNDQYLGALNRETREIMWNDDICTLRFKCIMIMIGNPLQMIGRFACALVKGIVSVVYAVFRLDLEALRETIVGILRIPYYALGIELAALIGLFYEPLKARERIGLLEVALQGGPIRTRIPCCQIEDDTFFLAPCFQPWVNNIDNNTQGYYLPPPAVEVLCPEPNELD